MQIHYLIWFDLDQSDDQLRKSGGMVDGLSFLSPSPNDWITLGLLTTSEKCWTTWSLHMQMACTTTTAAATATNASVTVTMRRWRPKLSPRTLKCAWDHIARRGPNEQRLQKLKQRTTEACGARLGKLLEVDWVSSARSGPRCRSVNRSIERWALGEVGSISN